LGDQPPKSDVLDVLTMTSGDFTLLSHFGMWGCSQQVGLSPTTMALTYDDSKELDYIHSSNYRCICHLLQLVCTSSSKPTAHHFTIISMLFGEPSLNVAILGN
jgi:hypothetical protein